MIYVLGKTPQLREECTRSNIDLTRVKATRRTVVRDGRTIHVLQVEHEPTVVDVRPRVPDDMDALVLECTDMSRAEQALFWIAFHAQRAERLIVREMLGITGMSVHTMQTTPLSDDEIAAAKEELKFRSERDRLMSRVQQARIDRAAKDKAAANEKKLRELAGKTVVQESPKPNKARTETAQKRADYRAQQIAVGGELFSLEVNHG